MLRKSKPLHQIPSFEEYLEQIFRICVNNDNKGTSILNLANKLNFTPPSVYEMLHKLEGQKLVLKKNKKYFLTKKGEKIALLIVSNNVSLKIFLSKILKFTDEEFLENVVCGLEHFLPIEVNKRLIKALGIDDLDYKSKEVLQSYYFKYFDDMTIINVKQFEELIIEYKMKMANEIPNAWNIINKLFNEFRNIVLKEED